MPNVTQLGRARPEIQNQAFPLQSRPCTPMLLPQSCPRAPSFPRTLLATHVSGHDAATGTSHGQEEEGRRAQEASSTDQGVSPGVGVAEAAADLHAQAHTQDTSQAGDEPKNEAGGRRRDVRMSLSPCKAPWPHSYGLERQTVHPSTLTTQVYPHNSPRFTKFLSPTSQTRKQTLGEERSLWD